MSKVLLGLGIGIVAILTFMDRCERVMMRGCKEAVGSGCLLMYYQHSARFIYSVDKCNSNCCYSTTREWRRSSLFAAAPAAVGFMHCSNASVCTLRCTFLYSFMARCDIVCSTAPSPPSPPPPPLFAFLKDH